MRVIKLPNQPVASLTCGLLARKGFARPAMRLPLLDDDLGWNDIGDDVPVPLAEPGFPHAAAPNAVLQQQAMARLICVPPGSRRRRRGIALAQGRRAAFTLRVDAQRHAALRLACGLTSRSAQSLLIEALDRFLVALPEAATDLHDKEIET